MRIVVAISVYGVVLNAFGACAQPSEKTTADPFDKPLRVERIALPKDPLNEQAEPLLSCFHYDNLIVKQIYRGGKGAEQLSLIPSDAIQPNAQCSEATVARETVIDGGEWAGYFMGARANHVFFGADDAWNGGEGFAVFLSLIHI